MTRQLVFLFSNFEFFQWDKRVSAYKTSNGRKENWAKAARGLESCNERLREQSNGCSSIEHYDGLFCSCEYTLIPNFDTNDDTILFKWPSTITQGRPVLLTRPFTIVRDSWTMNEQLSSSTLSQGCTLKKVTNFSPCVTYLIFQRLCHSLIDTDLDLLYFNWLYWPIRWRNKLKYNHDLIRLQFFVLPQDAVWLFMTDNDLWTDLWNLRYVKDRVKHKACKA